MTIRVLFDTTTAIIGGRQASSSFMAPCTHTRITTRARAPTAEIFDLALGEHLPDKLPTYHTCVMLPADVVFADPPLKASC